MLLSLVYLSETTSEGEAMSPHWMLLGLIGRLTREEAEEVIEFIRFLRGEPDITALLSPLAQSVEAHYRRN